jgi:Rrf2 family protein
MAAACLGLIGEAGDNGVQIQQLADATGISRPTMGKLINALARKRLVRTRRGVGGGVTLLKPSSRITLYDLCVVLDDPAIECRCMFGFGHCASDGACPPGCLCIAQHSKRLAFLKRTAVADVARAMQRCKCSTSKMARAARNVRRT